MAAPSPTARVLIALAIAVVIGTICSTTLPSAKPVAIPIADAVGTLWINALRMTVIPLVVSLLITAIATSADVRTVPRLAGRALVIFVAFLTAAALASAAITAAALNWLPPDSRPFFTPARGAVAADVNASMTVAQWVTSLIPANPFKAAADGSMLPLIVFSVAFGFALLSIAADRRRLGVTALQAVADAMLVILRWILWLAPLGVFCLAFSLVANGGIAAIGLLAYYVLLLCIILVLGTAVVLAVAGLSGRVDVRSFIQALAPALIVAFSTRSSMAALPVLIKAANRLALPVAATAFVLPFATSIFRLSVPITQTLAAMLVAHVSGVNLAPAQLVSLLAMAVLLSFSSPGIPSASFLVMVPVFEALGLPTSAIGPLLAVDAIPDAFKTVLNVASQATATTLATPIEESPLLNRAPVGAVDLASPRRTRFPPQ